MPKSRRFIKAIVLWLLVVFFVPMTFAWAAPLTLTQKDSGKTFTVSVGQRLVVDLSLGPGHCVVAPEFDPWVLTILGQSITSTSGSQGASSRVVYQFLVRQSGQTELVIAARGQGNQGDKPTPFLKVKIVATGGGQGV